MFNRIFGKKPKKQANSNALAALDHLNETHAYLEMKEKALEQKAAAELKRAKEFSKAKNKRAAIQSLKRKTLFEKHIQELENYQLTIQNQMNMLDAAKCKTETVDALRAGAAAMKAMQKNINFDDVDKTMDEINEHTEDMKQIQDALSAPRGGSADFGEDELEAELEELEGVESQLLEPVAAPSVHPVHVPATKQPALPAQQKATAEDVELAALQERTAKAILRAENFLSQLSPQAIL